MCLLITILGIVFGTRVTRRRKKRASSRNSPPGPRRLPIIGNLHQLVLLGGQLPLHQRLRELARAHGPVMRLQLGQLRHVVVTSAEAAEQNMYVQDMFLAGTDTTTRTIEWAMAEMMKNPSAMQKAQTEASKETLRLHPPGPFLIPRESREEANVGGFDIPVRSQVLVNVWAIGRDPRYWNEADKFSPERFLNSTTDYRGAHFQFLPFGAGRRMCPGIQFGMVVVQLALANLLFHFDWKLPNEMKPEDLDLTEEFSDNALKMRETLLLIPVARRIGSP
ncbi:unnamed protein product [Linum tenue]|uniref:Cytochrome P450 n=1 Tax=Linum tenue TaxID=586396 RepID=A0AAV0M4K8_9ROSI|nr:unnamed protein product [Linum tenue]